jgi:hypothetical protein
MHKAAFLSLADNVRALLELGASPNYRDLIGLTVSSFNFLSCTFPSQNTTHMCSQICF